MNLLRRLIPYFTTSLILGGLILFLALSCQDNQNAGLDSNSVGQIDSVEIWINQARLKDISIEERRNYIGKAFNTVQKWKKDSVALRQLSKIQWTYMSLGDSLHFRQSNRQTRELAQVIGDSVRMGNTYWDLGEFFDRSNSKDSAFFYLTRAKNIFKSIGNDQTAGNVLYDIAALESKVKDYTASEGSAIEALALLKPIDDNVMLYHLYNLLGSVAKDLRNYEKALGQYEFADNYLDKLKNTGNTKLALFNNIGNVYRELGDFETAISYYEKALGDEGLEQTSPDLYARALNNLAYSQFRSGNLTKVEQGLKKALSIRHRENDLTGISASNYHLAEYYYYKKDSAKALAYALESKKFAKLSSNNDRLLETLALLTKIDQRNATRYSQEHFRLNDSLLLVERQIRNKFARIQYETEEVEAKNQVLARQMQIWIGIALGLFLLALSIFIIITQRVKNQKLQFQQQQQEANNEIFSLMLAQNQKIEEGKKSEQKRISEELHDGVLGEMNGARMILMGLNEKTGEDVIAMRSTAITKLQEVQEEIRTISHELSDAAYQKFHNFIISIQELLTSVGDSASLEYSFTYDEEIDWDSLTADIKINLYRIVQECLMNCIKHAQAKNISLDFDVKGEMLLVHIKDDGKGFDPNKGKKGIGHKNINSRVVKINGSWSVSSKLGKGTTVAIEIPLAHAESQIDKDLVALNK